ncbi:ESX-1 secretion-associated protein EspL, partial [Frankliniella fusca]
MASKAGPVALFHVLIIYSTKINKTKFHKFNLLEVYSVYAANTRSTGELESDPVSQGNRLVNTDFYGVKVPADPDAHIRPNGHRWLVGLCVEDQLMDQGRRGAVASGRTVSVSVHPQRGG